MTNGSRPDEVLEMAAPLAFVLITKPSTKIMEIRIINTPPGEAPEHVRKAWVGLILPLAVSGARTRHTVGILARKEFLGMLFALLTGRTDRHSGYIVDAVETLATRSPDAAKWWRENATRFDQARPPIPFCG